jgi:hypothetical protein
VIEGGWTALRYVLLDAGDDSVKCGG